MAESSTPETSDSLENARENVKLTDTQLVNACISKAGGPTALARLMDYPWRRVIDMRQGWCYNKKGRRARPLMRWERFYLEAYLRGDPL